MTSAQTLMELSKPIKAATQCGLAPERAAIAVVRPSSVDLERANVRLLFNFAIKRQQSTKGAL
jgi:hypothetical protein